jgi:AbrB family looped-hinge helix DNA binding protein
MKPVTVDGKGRVILPLALREQFGITKGDVLWFVATTNGLELRRAAPPAEGLGPVAEAALAEFEAGKTKPLRQLMTETQARPVLRKARPHRTKSTSRSARKLTLKRTDR